MLIIDYASRIVKSLTNDSLVIASNKDKKSITVNDIPLVQTDILAANGNFLSISILSSTLK